MTYLLDPIERLSRKERIKLIVRRCVWLIGFIPMLAVGLSVFVLSVFFAAAALGVCWLLTMPGSKTVWMFEYGLNTLDYIWSGWNRVARFDL